MHNSELRLYLICAFNNSVCCLHMGYNIHFQQLYCCDCKCIYLYIHIYIAIGTLYKGQYIYIIYIYFLVLYVYIYICIYVYMYIDINKRINIYKVNQVRWMIHHGVIGIQTNSCVDKTICLLPSPWSTPERPGDQQSQKYPPKSSVRKLFTLLGKNRIWGGSIFRFWGVDKYL